VATGDCLRIITGVTRHGAVYGAAFSPDGTLLATGSADKAARLWDVATGGCLHTITGHPDFVYEPAFSPDGTLLATASADKTARLWDVATGALVCTLTKRGVAFSPDGTLLATNIGNTVQLWALT
jgi:WD40 repeat protein